MCRCNACSFATQWAWQLQAGISRQGRAHLAGGSPAVAPHPEDLLAHAGACLPLCYAAGELVVPLSCAAHTCLPKLWVMDFITRSLQWRPLSHACPPRLALRPSQRTALQLPLWFQAAPHRLNAPLPIAFMQAAAPIALCRLAALPSSRRCTLAS